MDDKFDHKLILSSDDPLFDVLKMYTPITLLDGHTTAEVLAMYIFNEFKEMDQRVCKVTVFETPNCSATFGS